MGHFLKSETEKAPSEVELFFLSLNKNNKILYEGTRDEISLYKYDYQELHKQKMMLNEAYLFYLTPRIKSYASIKYS